MAKAKAQVSLSTKILTQTIYQKILTQSLSYIKHLMFSSMYYKPKLLTLPFTPVFLQH